MRRDEKGESRVVRTIDAFSVDLQKFLDPPRPISCDVHETVASHGEMNSGWMQKLLGYGVLISAFACLLGFFWWVLWVIFVPSSLVMALTYLIFDYFSQAKSELRYLKFMIKKSGTELHEFYRNSRMEIASLENHARKLKNLVRTARIDLELLDETWSNGLYQGLQAEDLEPIREPRTQMNLHHR
jgi:hypothetical protein